MNAYTGNKVILRHYHGSHSYTYCAGSSALKVHKIPQFTLIEGGKSQECSVAAHEQRHVSSSTRPEQIPLVIFFALLTLSMFLALHISTSLKQIHYVSVTQDLALESHVVMPGDSLWTIAQTHSISSLTTQETLRFIEQHNQLDLSLPLMPGQVILVPQAP